MHGGDQKAKFLYTIAQAIGVSHRAMGAMQHHARSPSVGSGAAKQVSGLAGDPIGKRKRSIVALVGFRVLL
jgi:hypothetical protein